MRDIGMVLATDPDGDRLTYTLDTASDALFRIMRTFTGGQLETKVELEYDGPPVPTRRYTVTVFVSDRKDADGMPVDDDSPDIDDSITVTVNVINVNDDPEFVKADGTPISSIREVAENKGAGEAVTDPEGVKDPVEAIDRDGNTLKYSLRNADTVPFDIDPGTGQLTTTASLDHEDEDTYRVVVEVSDRKYADDMDVDAETADIDATITITINVTDVDETDNDPPVFVNTAGNTITSATRTVKENAATANVGLPVEANDPDIGDTVTHTIDSDSEAFFAIDANTGQLTTKVIRGSTMKQIVTWMIASPVPITSMR